MLHGKPFAGVLCPWLGAGIWRVYQFHSSISMIADKIQALLNASPIVKCDCDVCAQEICHRRHSTVLPVHFCFFCLPTSQPVIKTIIQLLFSNLQPLGRSFWRPTSCRYFCTHSHIIQYTSIIIQDKQPQFDHHLQRTTPFDRHLRWLWSLKQAM